jgi:uncharacterized protein YceH (UPF0502 family)
MIQLNPNESRVLGVLIEKATTTPDQYPLSLNAVTNGSNQKNNRDPVRSMSEDECFEALESLRSKSLVMRVDQAGSRVPKYRHNLTETLHVRTGEQAILAELLLRGPQTIGELRGRAGRMSPMDSLEVAQGLVQALITRPEPLVKQLPPSPGSRAERFMQLLCPDLHGIEAIASPQPAESAAPAPLSTRVALLESEVAELKIEIQKLNDRLPGSPRSNQSDE